MQNEWDDSSIHFFNKLANHFHLLSDYHSGRNKLWRFIHIFVVITIALLSYSSLLLINVTDDQKFITYYNFCSNVLISIFTQYTLVVDPSNASAIHDGSSSEYLEMSSRISTQLQRKSEHRKSVENLMREMKSKYDVIVSRTKPPTHLKFPTLNSTLI